MHSSIDKSGKSFIILSLLSSVREYSRKGSPVCRLIRIWSQWLTISQSTSNTWRLRSNSARYVQRWICVCICSYCTLLLGYVSFYFYVFVCVWLQEELQGMKQRIRVVVVENEKLHSDLKSKAMEESLKEFTLRNTTVMCVKNTCVWSLSLW